MAKVLTYKQDEYIWIICKRSVYIRQLRKSGPIVAPLKVKMATAYSIVCSGIELYQYCPVTREIVKMTVQNAYRVDKFPKYYAIITKGGTTNTKDDDDSTKGPAANMLMRAAAPDPAANKSEEQEGEVTPDESKVTAGNEDEKTPDPAANVDDGAEGKETEENEAPEEGAVDVDGVAENEEESEETESESDNEEDGEKESSEEKKEDKQPDAPSNSGNKRKKKK